MVLSIDLWRIRAPGDKFDPFTAYVPGSMLFSIKVFHGGKFHGFPNRTYKGGRVNWIDVVDADELSVIEVSRMVMKLGYAQGSCLFYHFKVPGGNLDTGLKALGCDQDVISLMEYVPANKVIEVYVEHNVTVLDTYIKSPFKRAKDKVVVEELPSDVLMASPPLNRRRRRLLQEDGGSSKVKKLLLELPGFMGSVPEEAGVPDNQSVTTDEDWFDKYIQNMKDADGNPIPPITIEDDELVMTDQQPDVVDLGNDDPATGMPPQPDVVGGNSGVNASSDGEDERENGDRSRTRTESSNDGDSDDSDYQPPFFDEEHEVHEVHVDMKDFRLNTDPEVEHCPYYKSVHNQEGIQYGEGIDVRGLNFEEVEHLSSEEDCLTETGDRRQKKKVKYPQYLRSRDYENPQFFIGQEFGTAHEVREAVKVHSIMTRRQLTFKKNDDIRIRAICVGTIPTPEDREENEKDSENDKEAEEAQSDNGDEAAPNEEPEKPPPCPWVLLVSRSKYSTTWQVKTYVDTHTCLPSRTIKACTSNFLAEKIEDEVRTNPNIPVAALKETLQQKFHVGVSKMKAFRAKVRAHDNIIGTYKHQYGILRDYALELQRTNPGTTVKIDVEPCPIPHEPTRVFRRIYICLGSLKQGFLAGCRELLGLDGTFIKGPYPGQLLTAVGVDSNNGIYPVAYAIVEAETMKAWEWFLENLQDDLNLNKESNYTFITDRQKGLIPALAKVFPYAEHRFCLKHIYDNMKKTYRGKHYKDLLWEAATATTVNSFQKVLDDIAKLDQQAHKWVASIGHHHWSRSHFSGRAQCDILYNNICETLNKQLVDARDKPIITLLEYTRAYLMKRLVVVEKEMKKCNGPLCPSITKIFEDIKHKANSYHVMWNGSNSYQVSGNQGDQCIVNLKEKECSCRKWEVSGIPCKHAVAAIWDLGMNGGNGIPETWVDKAFWLDTWKKIYKPKIQPINGPREWPKSQCPSSLLPPLHHVPPGRPRKARRKDPDEAKADSQKRRQSQSQSSQPSNRLSRSTVMLKCSKCGNQGHNARTCKGQKQSEQPNVPVEQNSTQTNQQSSQVPVRTQRPSTAGICIREPQEHMGQITGRQGGRRLVNINGVMFSTQVAGGIKPKDKGKGKASSSQP